MLTAGRLRLLAAVAVVLLLAPTAVSAVQAGGHDVSESGASGSNITFVSVQGKALMWAGSGGVFAVDTDTRQVVWRHTDGSSYYDIDPLDADRLLVVLTNGTTGQKQAVVFDWRANERLQSFPVPADTHDVDHLRESRFVVADKKDHRVYVYDTDDDRIVWEYDYRRHFDDSNGTPGDFTHLNDVDAVENGSYFLTSPRNFDRVHLINRSSKEVVWTLGEEDRYSVLYEQHNPVLLDRSPPTVLVADSENDRVVEYERRNDSWARTWSYEGGDDRHLAWPRDADRLPNGNTLVADTANGRVIEVTPSKEIVWEFQIGPSVYDVERLRYGDEPAGPPMSELASGQHTTDPERASVLGVLDSDLASTMGDKLTKGLEFAYQKIGFWILPSWADRSDFYSLLGAAVLAVVWGGSETVLALRARGVTSRIRGRLDSGFAAIQTVGIVLGIATIAVSPLFVGDGRTALYFHALLGILIVASNARSFSKHLQRRIPFERPTFEVVLGASSLATIAVGAALLFAQVSADPASSLTVLFAGVVAAAMLANAHQWRSWMGAFPWYGMVALTAFALGTVALGLMTVLLSFSLAEAYTALPKGTEGLSLYLFVGVLVAAIGTQSVTLPPSARERLTGNPIVTVLEGLLGLAFVVVGGSLLFAQSPNPVEPSTVVYLGLVATGLGWFDPEKVRSSDR